MKNKKAFTLIELLVVVSIIAILLSILMPALSTAKEKAKHVVCLADLKGLTTSWQGYSADHNGNLAPAKTNVIDPSGGWHWVPVTDPVTNVTKVEKTWVGKYPPNTGNMPPFLDGSPLDPQEREGRLEAVKMGTFFPYSENEKIYRCPLSRVKGQARNYTFVDSLNGVNLADVPGSSYPHWKPYLKYSQIPTASLRFAFLCEDDTSGGGGWSIVPFGDLATSPYDYWDAPPSQHGGVCNSFVDGSAQYWKYETQDGLRYVREKKPNVYNRTNIAYPGKAEGLSDQEAVPNNADYIKLRKGVWGD